MSRSPTQDELIKDAYRNGQEEERSRIAAILQADISELDVLIRSLEDKIRNATAIAEWDNVAEYAADRKELRGIKQALSQVLKKIEGGKK